MTLTKLQRQIVDKIRKPDERSLQKNIGPSEIGGCPFCLGLRLAVKCPEIYGLEPTPSESGLAAWIGTQVHYALEHNLGLGQPESKWEVYDLKGYGTISGHVDLILEDEIVDYKVTGKWSYDNMALDYRIEPDRIPKTQYRVQQMLYGHAVRKAGHEVKAVNLMVIPKHSNRWEDIAFYREPYNQEVVDKALARLELIWQYVQEGKLQELPRDDDCYNCSRSIW